MIKLSQLIQADTVKLIFPNNAGENPLDIFDDIETIKDWMFYQYPYYQFNFKEGEIVLGLAKIAKDLFVVASVEQILDKFNVPEGRGYKSKTLLEYSDYKGRLLIKYINNATQLKRDFKEIADNLEVYALLPEADKLF